MKQIELFFPSTLNPQILITVLTENGVTMEEQPDMMQTWKTLEYFHAEQK